MSHFDDIDFVFWGPGPSGHIGAIIFLALAITLTVWAVTQDSKSEDMCAEHGEKYVDSREDYTLCEQDGGTVVRR